MSVAQLEQQKSNAKKLIAQRDLALKLRRNTEFRKLILEEYMVNEAARYAALSADPVLTPAQRADAIAMAQAPGHLKRWLSVLAAMGDTAEGEMDDLDLQIEEARIEEEHEQAERDAEEAEREEGERGTLQ